jgi:hypothetical protein
MSATELLDKLFFTVKALCVLRFPLLRKFSEYINTSSKSNTDYTELLIYRKIYLNPRI